MSGLWDMLQDSYASPEGTFSSPAVNRGSASDKQLSLIEKLSGGSGDTLAGIRFGKNLMELSSAEASLLIGTLSRYENE